MNYRLSIGKTSHINAESEFVKLKREIISVYLLFSHASDVLIFHSTECSQQALLDDAKWIAKCSF